MRFSMDLTMCITYAIKSTKYETANHSPLPVVAIVCSMKSPQLYIPKSRHRSKPTSGVSIFYWVASLKDYFDRCYPDFFQPMDYADGNMLRAPSMNGVGHWH